MRKLIPLLTAAALFTGGLAALPHPATAQPLPAVTSTAAPLPATPVHWDRGYGYGGGYYASPPPPPPWYGRPHYRGYYGRGGYYGGGGYDAPPPPPRWGGGWYR